MGTSTPGVTCLVVLGSYVGLRDGAREVKHGEQGEHTGLDERNQYAEAEDGDLQKIGKQEEQHDQELVLGDHVSEETKAEREHPGKMADALNNEHERRERPQRSEEMLDVAEAMLADADVVCRGKGDQRQGQRRVQVRRGRIETGNEAEEITNENKEEQRSDEREVALSLRPHDLFDEVHQAAYDDFHDVLDAARRGLFHVQAHGTGNPYEKGD